MKFFMHLFSIMMAHYPFFIHELLTGFLIRILSMCSRSDFSCRNNSCRRSQLLFVRVILSPFYAFSIYMLIFRNSIAACLLYLRTIQYLHEVRWCRIGMLHVAVSKALPELLRTYNFRHVHCVCLDNKWQRA